MLSSTGPLSADRDVFFFFWRNLINICFISLFLPFYFLYFWRFLGVEINKPLVCRQGWVFFFFLFFFWEKPSKFPIDFCFISLFLTIYFIYCSYLFVFTYR